MAYYLIHTCNSRFWYVKEYLIPSMMLQGIPAQNIFVYRDYNEIGNLRAFIDSCNKASVQCQKKGIDGLWHLQDDVMISKDFKKVTEQFENHDLVCGFTCGYDIQPEAGTFKLEEHKMWYSFPCINISTALTTEFANWANCNLWQSQHFKEAVKRNNCDDLIFREWLYDTHGHTEEINLDPNVVNHIDKWLGGSICNKQRDPDKDTMSIFWEDKGELETLRRELETYKKKYKPELL